MELYHLRSFITVAEEQNLTRAAQKLFASPPSVSAHIKSLEEDLQVTLFIRSPKGMKLTHAGEALKEKAVHILNAAQNFLDSAHDLRNEPTGHIKFGLNFPPERLRISALFERMNTSYPQVTIELVSSSTGRILEALLDRTMDVGCIYGTPASNLNVTHHLLTVELVIAAPVNWTDKIKKATWEDVARMPWIRDPHDCPFQDLADDLFNRLGLTLNQAISSNEDATRLEMVEGGVGLSVLERQFAEASDQVVIWETDHPLYSDLHVAHLKSRTDEPAIRAVTEKVLSIWRAESEVLKAG